MAVMALIIILAVDILKNIGHFTVKGKDMVHYLKGPEQFIKTVKENDIRIRLEDDPHYIEKMFPHAMLFGQIEHWIEIYDILEVPTPQWSSGNIYNMSYIQSNFNNSMLAPSNSGTVSSYGVYLGGGSLDDVSSGGGSGGGGSW